MTCNECANKIRASKNRVDRSGEKYGRLDILEAIPNTNPTQVKCRCDCGNIYIGIQSDIVSGHTQSCGCLQREIVAKAKSTHQQSGSRLYSVWRGMKERCYITSAINYSYYGGRGITICDEWINSFQAFYDWAMSHGYQDDLTIDRIDNDGNYEPSNCHWTTVKKQSLNKSDNHVVTLNGISKPLIVWCEEHGINYKTVRDRLKRGWSYQDALSKPVQTKRRRKVS
jgi:hypothetical protein